jgi:uncharacterized protein (TIGR03000 family)
VFPAAPAAPAYLEIRLPAEAELWIDGASTQQTGPARVFVSPPLSPGKDYVYVIRARWNQDGQAQDQTRPVTVHAGERVPVEF